MMGTYSLDPPSPGDSLDPTVGGLICRQAEFKAERIRHFRTRLRSPVVCGQLVGNAIRRSRLRFLGIAETSAWPSLPAMGRPRQRCFSTSPRPAAACRLIPPTRPRNSSSTPSFVVTNHAPDSPAWADRLKLPVIRLVAKAHPAASNP